MGLRLKYIFHIFLFLFCFSNRFISEVNLKPKGEKVKTQDVAKVITMKREKTMWKPCSDLCKRFNVPEPFGGYLLLICLY